MAQFKDLAIGSYFRDRWGHLYRKDSLSFGEIVDLGPNTPNRGRRYRFDDVDAEVGPVAVAVREVRLEGDFRRLSYYTLCKLQDVTHYANPIHGLPGAIARGEYRGRLTLDALGNFISFE